MYKNRKPPTIDPTKAKPENTRNKKKTSNKKKPL